MSTTFTPHFAQVPFHILKRDDINTTAKVVYSILCGFRNAVTGLCFPKYRTIGAAGSLSKGQVQAAVRHLEEASLLKHVWSEEYQCFVFELAEFVTPAEKEEKPRESTGCDKPDEGVRNFAGGGTKKSTPYKHNNQHNKNHINNSFFKKEKIEPKEFPELTDTFLLTLMREAQDICEQHLCTSFANHLDVECFRDWCLARNVRSHDWRAAWRNWVRNAMNLPCNEKKLAIARFEFKQQADEIFGKRAA